MRTFLAEVALEEGQIRERIRQARKEAGLTQEEAADLLHVHKRTWENWERANSGVGIPWDQIDNIAARLNKTPEWLLHGDDYVPAGDVKKLVDEAVEKGVAELRESIERLEEILRAKNSDTS